MTRDVVVELFNSLLMFGFGMFTVWCVYRYAIRKLELLGRPLLTRRDDLVPPLPEQTRTE